MIGRAVHSWRPARACASLLVVACAALALSVTPASAAEPCTNEKLRGESNTNPVTKQPYSRGLPECRAFEMVSPLYKQGHSAGHFGGFGPRGGIPVAPNGETVGFSSEGDFAEPENYAVNIFPTNAYLSRRGASGWTTLSAFAPRQYVDTPAFDNGIDSDFSPDLRLVQVSCGFRSLVKGEQKGLGIACAKRDAEGPWAPTQLYPGVEGGTVEATGYKGGSSDLSRVFFQPVQFHLLPGVTSEDIYELAGVATAHEELRVVNVDNSGNELLDNSGLEPAAGPRLGDNRGQQLIGSANHAISEDGGTVFFTATPTAKQQPAGEQLTVYARVGAKETVAVSNPSPSECTTCSKEAKPATFQGASADGSKVFFTTEQQLLNSDTDTTTDLYEYDFKKPAGENLTQISGGGGPGANVLGVVRTSSDGTHVYFVAQGVLTTEANGNEEKAMAGESNLYGYDTETGKTKFVATLTKAPINPLWGEGDAQEREAQTTRDGHYLIFSFPVKLAGDTNSSSAQAVYRYDFETRELTWISHPEPGAPGEEGKSATITSLNFARSGADAMIDDWNRAISENGESIVFTTSEQLQESDKDGATDVYLWHNGTVSMISAGGGGDPAMSLSGRDIFFTTFTQLVGQDSDVLGDVYDARVGGGFPKPAAEPSCSGDTCQELPKPLPSFGSAPSSVTPAGGNLPPTNPGPPSPPPPPPKHLTEAQLLANALAACKHKAKNKRAACELQARKRYGAQQFAQALKACKHKAKNKRAACERQARKRYGR
jgi:hypothetical protein